MNDRVSIQKVLEELIQTKSFEKLGSFSDFSFLNSLSQDEKNLLAKLYILQAEELLKQPVEPHLVEVAKKSLNKAIELQPQNHNAWYQRGLLFAKSEEKMDLREALLSFDYALECEPSFFDGWYASANVLCRLAVLENEDSLLCDAEDRFKKAETFFEKERGGEFYWHRGLVMYMLAKRSGEPSEFFKTISFYKIALELGLKTELFYSDYANALVEYASLLKLDELISQACDLYLLSLPETLDDFDKLKNQNERAKEISVRYLNLAGCYYYLFRSRLEKNYFLLAYDAFEKAHRLDPFLFQTHFHWGRLLSFASKLWQDAGHLRQALQRFEESLKLKADEPALFASFAEALSTLGNHEENTDFLQRAKLMIEKGLALDPENDELKSQEAYLLYQLGRYFSSEKYYEMALIKLSECLLQDQKQGRLWYNQALCQFSLGELKSDIALLNDALSSFSKASKFEMGRFGYFYNDWGLVLVTIAEQLREKKFLHEAEEKFERAILLHDTVEPEWLYNYGCTLDFLGDFTDEESYYERAVQALSAALQLDPNFTSARCHLACALANLGEMNDEVELFLKAFDHFRQVIEDDPEDDLAYNEWGVSILHFIDLTEDHGTDQSELFELAEKNFLTAVQLGNLYAFYNISCLYSMKENIADAIFYFEKALDCEVHPSIEELAQDEWLSNLRSTQYFHNFLEQNKEVD